MFALHRTCSILLTLNIHLLIAGGFSEVYQPTQQEIDRFQLIQEQIRQHQQQEQQQLKQQQQLQQPNQPASPQPENPPYIVSPLFSHLASLLLNKHLMMQQQQQQQDSNIEVPSKHPPMLAPQMVHAPPVHLAQPQLVQGHMNVHPGMLPQHNPNDLHNPMNGYPMTGHIDQRMQLISAKLDEKKTPIEFNVRRPDTGELEESDRRDQSTTLTDNHHHDKDHRGYGPPYRCYSCTWSIAQCSDFNCYNNPDVCTNNNFSPHMLHQADCPGGCEQFVVTDPNGLVQQWKRGCAPPSLPITRIRCQTHYEFGIRIDRCVCNSDWCNHGHWTFSLNHYLLVLAILLSIILC